MTLLKKYTQDVVLNLLIVRQVAVNLTTEERERDLPFTPMFNKRLRNILVLLAIVVLITTALFLGSHHCPAQGIAFTEARRSFHRLKNRTALPRPSDFDSNVTLVALMQPGADEARWSTSRAARVEGYVVAIGEAGVELANCYVRRDIHINLAQHQNSPSHEQVVLEVTPPMQDWAKRQGWDWSEEVLKKELIGHWCVFEGWLFFDTTHAGESENIAPGRPGNWRATGWEIHPITNFKVIP